MFKLTKFTGEEFLVNPDMIKIVEDCGDTVVTFVTGERVLVKESSEMVRRRFLAYKKETGAQMPFVDTRVYATVEE